MLFPSWQASLLSPAPSPCQSSLSSFSLLFLFALCLHFDNLTLSILPNFLCSFRNTRSLLQGRKQTMTSPQVTPWKYTPLFSRNHVPRKPQSLKSCFGLCLDRSTVHSNNNPSACCVFGSTAIWLGYINLRASTLHCFFIVLFSLTQVKDKTGTWLLNDKWLFAVIFSICSYQMV